MSPILQSSLESLGPVTLHFSTGLLKTEVDQKPHDPNYRLLEKQGYLKDRQGCAATKRQSL